MANDNDTGDSILESIGGASTGRGASAGGTDPDAEQVTAEHPGRYTLKGEKGRGGIGRVLLAHDVHIGREVAVKELLLEHARGDASSSGRSTAFTARFLREARVTGQLEHPSIVPVYEVGRREDGTLYYTMKLVRGRTLGDALQECDDWDERLGLLGHFANVCHALAYAHSRGVIHRDIKPENVMVGEFGETVVLDWGLAKVRGEQDLRGEQIQRDVELLTGADSNQTLDGHAIGTPAYMSPEQAEGDIDAIDQRSDVWSLGAMLYEVLTGVPPFTGDTAYEIVGKVMREPVVPVAAREPRAPPELAAVAEKALARDQDDRYLSAAAVAEEIEAFRSGGRVEAHRYTAVQLVKRLLSQNKSAVAVAGIALLVGAAVLAWGYGNIIDERDRALKIQQRAETNLGQALGERAKAATAEQDWMAADLYAAAALERIEDPRVRGLYLELADTWRPTLQWDHRLGTECAEVAVSVDSKVVACPTHMAIILWNVETGEEVARLPSTGGWLRSVDVSSTGRYMVAVGHDQKIHVWDLLNREPMGSASSGHRSQLRAVRFSRDSAHLAVAAENGGVSLWRFTKGALERTLTLRRKGPPVPAVAFTPDAGVLAVADEKGGVAYYSVTDGTEIGAFSAHIQELHAVEVSPDGKLLATASEDGLVRLWNTSDGSLHNHLQGHEGAVLTLSFAEEGAVVITGGADGTVRSWKTENGKQLAQFPAHDGPVTSVAMGADRIVSASTNKSVRSWDTAATVRAKRLSSLYGTPRSLAISFDGQYLVAAGGENNARVFARLNGGMRGVLEDHDDTIGAAAYHPTKHVVATAGHDTYVRVWNLDPIVSGSGFKILNQAFQIESDHKLRAVAFSPDGARLAAAGDGREIRVWDVEGEGNSFVLRGHAATVTSLDFAPDVSYLASGSWDGTVRIWREIEGDEQILKGHDGNVYGVAFLPGGKRVVSVGADEVVHVWDIETGSEVRKLRGHEGPVWSVAGHPLGVVVASAGEDGSVILWGVESGKMLARFDVPGVKMTAVGFSPTGETLAAAGSDRKVRMWSLERLGVETQGLLAEAQSSYGLMLSGIVAQPDPDWKKEPTP